MICFAILTNRLRASASSSSDTFQKFSRQSRKSALVFWNLQCGILLICVCGLGVGVWVKLLDDVGWIFLLQFSQGNGENDLQTLASQIVFDYNFWKLFHNFYCECISDFRWIISTVCLYGLHDLMCSGFDIFLSLFIHMCVYVVYGYVVGEINLGQKGMW